MLVMALAILPGLAIAFYVWHLDRYNREPMQAIIVSFLMGIIAVAPALYIETHFSRLFEKTILSIIAGAFIGVALVEEGLKFLVLRYYAFTRKSFDEPLDGIVYSVLISMGFATIENVFYLYNENFSVALLRMFTSVPAHATFGVMMGYFAGKAKFVKTHSKQLLLRGLLYAIIAHGMYDAFLLLGENEWVKKSVSGTLLFTGALFSLYISIRLSRQLLRMHHATSQDMFHTANHLQMMEAGEDHIPLIRSLAQQVWPQTYAGMLSAAQIDYMMELMYSEAALKKQMQEGAAFFIVYNGTEPVGFCSVGAVEKGIYKLHKIYVLPSQQGRGTGKWVMEQLFKMLIQNGATILRLNVNRKNVAKDFYEKLGFQIIETGDFDIGNGFYMNDYIMEKKL